MRRLEGRPLCLVLTWRPRSAAGPRSPRAAGRRAARDGALRSSAPTRLGREDVTELAGLPAPELGDDDCSRRPPGCRCSSSSISRLSASTAGGDVPEGVAGLLRHAGCGGERGGSPGARGSRGRSDVRSTWTRSARRAAAARRRSSLRSRSSRTRAAHRGRESYDFAHDRCGPGLRRHEPRSAAAAAPARRRGARREVATRPRRACGGHRRAATGWRGERPRRPSIAAWPASGPESCWRPRRRSPTSARPSRSAIRRRPACTRRSATCSCSWASTGRRWRASRAAAALATDRAQLGRLEHKLGSFYHRRGDWDLAAAHYEARGRARRRRWGSSRASTPTAASTSTGRGRGEAALALARRALELAGAGRGRRGARAGAQHPRRARVERGRARRGPHGAPRTSIELAGALGDPVRAWPR